MLQNLWMCWVVTCSIVIPGVVLLAFLSTWWRPVDLREHGKLWYRFGIKLFAVAHARAEYVEERRRTRIIAMRGRVMVQQKIESDLRTAYLGEVG